MKRILSLLVVLTLVFSSVSVATASQVDKTTTEYIQKPTSTSTETVQEDVVLIPSESATTEQYTEPTTEKSLQLEAEEKKASVSLQKTTSYPEITSIAPAKNGLKISFSKFSGAYKYRVFIKNENKGKQWKKVSDTTSLSYTHKNLTNNKKYTYTVRAIGKNGKYISSFDKKGYEATYLSTPQLESAKSTTDGLKITWKHVSGAENYKVYVRKSGSWKTLGYTSGTNFTDKNVTSGASYTYTVRCVDSNNKSTSYFDTKGIKNTFVAAPEITKIENQKKGAKITWDKVNGANKYKVFYKVSKNSWKAIGTTKNNYLAHTGIKDRSTYTYTVRALNSKGAYVSSYDKTGVKNVFIAPVKFTSIEKVDSTMVLSWNKVNEAYGYRVYRKTYNGSWKTIGKVKNSQFTDADFPKDTLYTYTMRCIDENSNNISYHVTDTKYYYNGELANGKIKVDGSTMNFKDGKLSQGYVKVDSKLYYYNSNGVLQKNGIVGTKKEGYYYADKNGVCCESEEMRLAAEYMMKRCTGSTLKERMKTGFMYMSKNFPYNRTYDHPKKASDIPKLAIDMFKNERGNCFRYAACFACTAKIAGYRSRVVVGELLSGSGYWVPHGWTEVYVNGKWLISDPDMQMQYIYNPYAFYMNEKYRFSIRAIKKYEVTIVDGKAVWK